jgi:hypothetical protein
MSPSETLMSPDPADTIRVDSAGRGSKKKDENRWKIGKQQRDNIILERRIKVTAISLAHKRDFAVIIKSQD